MKRGKLIKREGEYRIWLVWAIGVYANGHPCVDLRAVCTRESVARGKSKMILDSAKDRKDLFVRRTEIEERVTDHCYGLEMQLLKSLPPGEGE